MLDTLIADEEFPEDGKGVDPNAETQVMSAFDVCEGPAKRENVHVRRPVLPGFLASLRLQRLRQSPYLDTHHDRVSPLHGFGYD